MTGGNPFFVTEALESRAPGVPVTVRGRRAIPCGAALARRARCVGTRVRRAGED